MLTVRDLGLLPECAAEDHGGTLLCADAPWVSACREVETVGDFAVVVADYADRLWGAGVRPGQVVAVVKSNHLDIQALQCAIVRIGGVPALLSVKMGAADLLACLGELQQPWLLTDADGAAALALAQGRLSELVPRVITLTADLSEPKAHQVTRRAGGDPVLITHSSGTTGKPKLVVHTSDSLYGHVAPQLQVVQAYDKASVSAKCLSFSHVRMSTSLLVTLNAGIPFLAITSADLDPVRASLLRYRPESLEAQPNMFLRWEALAGEDPNPFGPVGRFITSFDALHPRTLRTLLEASGHPDPIFIQAYGQTETGPVTLLMARRSDLREGRLAGRDVGAPFPGMEVRIVDDAGSVLPPATPGHIEVRTPARAEAVIGRPTLPDRDTWWPMGDIGLLRPDGHVELYDRLVDQVPGVPSTLRAEDVLLDELPGLSEIVIISAGGTPLAVAATTDGQPVPDSQWQAARRKAGLPDGTQIQYRPWEQLPVTGTVKVRRHLLLAADTQ